MTLPEQQAADPTATDVSVIIAAWNAAGFIQRAVSSALASTGVSVEVIVVDDASPDGGYDLVQGLAQMDSRIRAERLAVNSGPSVARNRALAMARGRYVAILDADDAFTPDRLAALVALADKTGVDIVADNMTEVDEGGRPLGDTPFLKSPVFAVARDIGLATWIKFNQPMKSVEALGYLKPLIRRCKLIGKRVSYDPALRNSEDYYLVAHLLAEGARMTYTPKPGYLYTRSSSSTSHRLQPSHTAAWLDAEKRFIARYSGKLSVGERAAVLRRQRGLRDVHQFVATLEAMKSGKATAVPGLLASDITSSGYTLTTLAKVAMGKAFKRKLV